MKYYFVILLLCAVQPLRGRVYNSNRTDILASVKEYPSFLHKCTATFVRPDFLLTSAHCLFCEGYCTLFVAAGVSFLSDRSSNSKLYSVHYTIIHPDYEPSPAQNDIGLIKLKEKVMEAAVFDLPVGFVEPRGIEANTYGWKFSSDGRDFQLQFTPAVGVSNAMCSLALNHYVGYPYVCALGRKTFSFGVYDNGSPLVTKLNGFWLLLGIYVRQGVYREVKIEIFQSIIPYLGWVNQMLVAPPDSNSVSFNNDSFSPSNIKPVVIPYRPVIPDQTPLPFIPPEVPHNDFNPDFSKGSGPGSNYPPPPVNQDKFVPNNPQSIFPVPSNQDKFNPSNSPNKFPVPSNQDKFNTNIFPAPSNNPQNMFPAPSNNPQNMFPAPSNNPQNMFPPPSNQDKFKPSNPQNMFPAPSNQDKFKPNNPQNMFPAPSNQDKFGPNNPQNGLPLSPSKDQMNSGPAKNQYSGSSFNPNLKPAFPPPGQTFMNNYPSRDNTISPPYQDGMSSGLAQGEYSSSDGDYYSMKSLPPVTT